MTEDVAQVLDAEFWSLELVTKVFDAEFRWPQHVTDVFDDEFLSQQVNPEDYYGSLDLIKTARSIQLKAGESPDN